ncbi:hypothetical protein [Streptomyces cellulosae]|uniref:hypothetical protein n=1 Tax=Streptomyces cellulosae TaxID=1968 RepID=UPI0004C9E3BB|nr:hypothetical protein [Streptomyces cellulosae]
MSSQQAVRQSTGVPQVTSVRDDHDIRIAVAYQVQLLIETIREVDFPDAIRAAAVEVSQPTPTSSTGIARVRM